MEKGDVTSAKVPIYKGKQFLDDFHDQCSNQICLEHELR